MCHCMSNFKERYAEKSYAYEETRTFRERFLAVARHQSTTRWSKEGALSARAKGKPCRREWGPWREKIVASAGQRRVAKASEEIKKRRGSWRRVQRRERTAGAGNPEERNEENRERGEETARRIGSLNLAVGRKSANRRYSWHALFSVVSSFQPRAFSSDVFCTHDFASFRFPRGAVCLSVCLSVRSFVRRANEKRKRHISFDAVWRIRESGGKGRNVAKVIERGQRKGCVTPRTRGQLWR